jgi:hypothetical protein
MNKKNGINWNLSQKFSTKVVHRWNDPDLLWAKAEEYFDQCQKLPNHHPTIVEISLYLGFNSRQTFYNKKKDPLFTEVITRIISTCELCMTNLALENGDYKKRVNPGTVALILKSQFGFHDSSVTETKDVPVTDQINWDKIPSDKIDDFIKMLNDSTNNES